MKLTVAAVLGTILLLGIPGRAVAGTSKPTVEKVLDFYQTIGFLKDGKKFFDAALARRNSQVKIPDQQFRKIQSLGHRIVPAKNLFEIFKIAYAKATTIEQMTTLYQWQIGPKGIKLAGAFRTLYESDQATWQAFFDKESPAHMKPNRTNAFNTYMKITEQELLYATFQSGMDLAVRMALNEYAPAGGRDTTKFMKRTVYEKNLGYFEEGRKRSTMVLFSLFKNYKNEEIDEVSTFMGTAHGQAHSKAYIRALKLTLESAAQTLAAQVAKEKSK